MCAATECDGEQKRATSSEEPASVRAPPNATTATTTRRRTRRIYSAPSQALPSSAKQIVAFNQHHQCSRSPHRRLPPYISSPDARASPAARCTSLSPSCCWRCCSFLPFSMLCESLSPPTAITHCPSSLRTPSLRLAGQDCLNGSCAEDLGQHTGQHICHQYHHWQ